MAPWVVWYAMVCDVSCYNEHHLSFQSRQVMNFTPQTVLMIWPFAGTHISTYVRVGNGEIIKCASHICSWDFIGYNPRHSIEHLKLNEISNYTTRHTCNNINRGPQLYGIGQIKRRSSLTYLSKFSMGKYWTSRVMFTPQMLNSNGVYSVWIHDLSIS